MPKDEIFKHKREGRKKRSESIRNERKTEWLIVCEGEKTEPNYFRALEKFLNENGSNKIKIRAIGQGRNTTDLVSHLDDYFKFFDKLLGNSSIPYDRFSIQKSFRQRQIKSQRQILKIPRRYGLQFARAHRHYLYKYFSGFFNRMHKPERRVKVLAGTEHAVMGPNHYIIPFH